jgi:hypothetical protein
MIAAEAAWWGTCQIFGWTIERKVVIFLIMSVASLPVLPLIYFILSDLYLSVWYE